MVEVDFGALGSDGYWLLDNIDYHGGGTVPEPGTLGMIGSGMVAGFAVMRRRLKRSLHL